MTASPEPVGRDDERAVSHFRGRAQSASRLTSASRSRASSATDCASTATPRDPCGSRPRSLPCSGRSRGGPAPRGPLGRVELVGEDRRLELEPVAPAPSGQVKTGTTRRSGLELQESERGGRGGQPAEERDEDRLVGEDVLVDEDRDGLALRGCRGGSPAPRPSCGSGDCRSACGAGRAPVPEEGCRADARPTRSARRAFRPAPRRAPSSRSARREGRRRLPRARARAGARRRRRPDRAARSRRATVRGGVQELDERGAELLERSRARWRRRLARRLLGKRVGEIAASRMRPARSGDASREPAAPAGPRRRPNAARDRPSERSDTARKERRARPAVPRARSAGAAHRAARPRVRGRRSRSETLMPISRPPERRAARGARNAKKPGSRPRRRAGRPRAAGAAGQLDRVLLGRDDRRCRRAGGGAPRSAPGRGRVVAVVVGKASVSSGREAELGERSRRTTGRATPQTASRRRSASAPASHRRARPQVAQSPAARIRAVKTGASGFHRRASAIALRGRPAAVDAREDEGVGAARGRRAARAAGREAGSARRRTDRARRAEADSTSRRTARCW